MKHESRKRRESATAAGVVFIVRCMSFGRRLELTQKVRELAGRREFLAAGDSKDAVAAADAAMLAAEIDREYLLWGLEGVEGLEIDGKPATTQSLIDEGPEEMVREALEAVRREVGLTGEERKNFKSHSISCKATKPDGDATNAAA